MWAPELAEPLIERLCEHPPPTTLASTATASGECPWIAIADVPASSANAGVLPNAADGETTDDGMGAPDHQDAEEADMD